MVGRGNLARGQIVIIILTGTMDRRCGFRQVLKIDLRPSRSNI